MTNGRKKWFLAPMEPRTEVIEVAVLLLTWPAGVAKAPSACTIWYGHVVWIGSCGRRFLQSWFLPAVVRGSLSEQVDMAEDVSEAEDTLRSALTLLVNLGKLLLQNAKQEAEGTVDLISSFSGHVDMRTWKWHFCRALLIFGLLRNPDKSLHTLFRILETWVIIHLRLKKTTRLFVKCSLHLTSISPILFTASSHLLHYRCHLVIYY